MKEFVRPKKTISEVNYYTLNNNLKVVGEFVDEPCYSELFEYDEYDNEGDHLEGISFIRTWIDPIYTPYDRRFILRWTKEIGNKFGLQCTFEGLTKVKGNYSFLIPVKDECEDPFRRELIATLMSVRYLWETSLYKIPYDYFKIRKELPKVAPFNAYQLAHYCSGPYISEGHCIFGGTLKKLSSLERFKDCLINDPEDLAGKWAGPALSEALMGDVSGTSVENSYESYKELYEIVSKIE